MQRLSYRTETVSSNKITRNRIVLSFKDSPRKPLGRPPDDDGKGRGERGVSETERRFEKGALRLAGTPSRDRMNNRHRIYGHLYISVIRPESVMLLVI